VDEEDGECCFDDWVDHWSKQSRRKPTVAGVTAPLLRGLEEAGIRDRTVLDVGCGIGDLAIEVVRHGAVRAFGVELSPKAVDEARRLAVERGVADRTSFEVGDGSQMPLPNTDVVVLNRVFCCYRDAEALLDNSLSAAGSVYAFTTPPSRGLGGAFVKLQARFWNVWYRLRDRKFRGFRVYIHDVDRIDARVQAVGFRPIRRERRRFVWHLAVYARPATAVTSDGARPRS
jgi:magnesium-protoporphyrin O-methyltransferase